MLQTGSIEQQVICSSWLPLERLGIVGVLFAGTGADPSKLPAGLRQPLPAAEGEEPTGRDWSCIARVGTSDFKATLAVQLDQGRFADFRQLGSSGGVFLDSCQTV